MGLNLFLLLILPMRNSDFIESPAMKICFLWKCWEDASVLWTAAQNFRIIMIFWLMKEYGDESSWTRICKIELDAEPWNFEYFKPLLFSKNGKKILMEGIDLIWYDITTKRGKKVKNRSFPKRFKTASCIGSLLLLDGDNVIDLKQKKNTRKR